MDGYILTILVFEREIKILKMIIINILTKCKNKLANMNMVNN